MAERRCTFNREFRVRVKLITQTGVTTEFNQNYLFLLRIHFWVQILRWGKPFTVKIDYNETKYNKIKFERKNFEVPAVTFVQKSNQIQQITQVPFGGGGDGWSFGFIKNNFHCTRQKKFHFCCEVGIVQDIGAYKQKKSFIVTIKICCFRKI